MREAVLPESLRYLAASPEAVGRPPVATATQLLDLGSLEPKDFERLCFRLARLDATVEAVRMYGVHGQQQEGIDLFTYRADQTYAAIQCKRSSDAFTPGEITAAVDKFLAGEWADQSAVFVLAVSAGLERTQTADQVEVERRRLAERDISFEVWDQTELSAVLKDHPRLVDDFFGRETVRMFNGHSAAEGLGERLDAGDVIAYRSQLKRLYHEVFWGLERGTHADDRYVPLEDRFVLPDVVVAEDPARLPPNAPTRAHAIASVEPGSGDSEGVSLISSSSDGLVAAARRNSRSEPSTSAAAAASDRIGVADWVATGQRHLVVGVPGAGKSALLRMIVLDLLADEPAFIGGVDRFQEVLPVWLPFSFWTNAARNGAMNVTDAVRAWLTAFDSEDLWPLVERALRDERALIVVDGLDEWASPDLARRCLNRLEVFAATRNTAVLASSRPFSPAELPVDRSRWRIATLAGLNPEQQREFVTRWLTPLASPAALAAEAATLAEEIDASAHLKELADLPLFLALLLQSREQRSEFPEDLYSVLDGAVSRLIGEHRRKKIAAAEDGAVFPRSSEIRKISSVTADHLHTRSLAAIDDQQLADCFRRALIDDLGYPHGDAHATANALIDALSPGMGLMVRPAPDETQFFHRSAQEFLAAEQLQTLPADDQTSLISEQLTDPHWTAVVRFLIRGLSRPKEISALFDTLAERAAGDPRYSEAVDLLAADIATGSGAADTATRRRLADRVINEIEYGERHAHQARLIGKLVSGLTRRELREPLMKVFRRWISGVETTSWYSLLSEAAESWDSGETLQGLLWHALHAHDERVQRLAGQLLGKTFNTPADTDRMAALATETRLPQRRAAATEALSLADPRHPTLDDLIASGVGHLDFAVRHASIAADLRRGNTTNAHRDALVNLFDAPANVGPWHDGLIDLMIEYFPDDDSIFSHYRGRLDVGQGPQKLAQERAASSVILRGYAQRPEARAHFLKLIAAACAEPSTAILHVNEIPWLTLGELYRDDVEVPVAIEKLIAVHGTNAVADRDLYFWSKLALTPRTRNHLLHRLTTTEVTGIGWTIRALLESWPDDDEVAERLAAIVHREPASIPYGVIPLLSDIITDPEEALTLLDRLALTHRRDRQVLSALKAILDAGADPKDPRTRRIIDLSVQSVPDVIWRSPESLLYLAFADHQPVHDLAVSRLDGRGVPYWAIAHGFADDAALREAISDRFRPLGSALRARLVEGLTSTPATADAAMELLALYDNEPDLTVKILEAAAYARLRIDAGNEVEDLLEALTAQSLEGGYDHQEREIAAFCAFAELGRLDLLGGLISPFSSKPVDLHPQYLGEDTQFFRYVARHWTDVIAAFGPEPAKRFGSTNDTLFYEHLLEVAHDYPDLHPHLATVLANTPDLAASDAVLLYRWRLEGPTADLRDLIITRLKRSADGNPRFLNQADETALHLLQEHFGDDPVTEEWLDTALAELRAHSPGDRPYVLPPGALASLARLRPGLPLLASLRDLTAGTPGQPWVHFHSWVELATASAATADDFIAVAVRLAGIVQLNDLDSSVAYRAPAARLRHAPDLASAVAERAPELDQPALGIISRLLSLTGHLDGPATSRLQKAAGVQDQAKAWTYDPLTGKIRHMAVMALDLLDTVDR